MTHLGSLGSLAPPFRCRWILGDGRCPQAVAVANSVDEMEGAGDLKARAVPVLLRALEDLCEGLQEVRRQLACGDSWHNKTAGI